jgi:DNA-binding SARP family transcriptional activator/ABC-type branched-subunit amino acid transport system substrate-binding protein
VGGTPDFRLLGPVEAGPDGRSVPLGGARRRAVLAMLALNAGTVLSTGRLIEGVWDEPPETAATALQGHISQLRRMLGEATIVTRAPGYLLDVAPETVDAVRCERALERARRQLAAGAAADAALTLSGARALWRGEPLADVGDAPFTQNALPALIELRVALEEERIDAELALGRNAEAIAPLRELVAREPLRERPRAQLMLALYRCGRQAEALDVYETGRRRLSEELGIEPGERLRELHGAIVRQDAALGTPRTVRPARRRRSWRALAAAGIAAGVIAAVVIATGGGSARRTQAPPIANGIVRVGADGAQLASAAIDGSPANAVAAGGDAWVVDADGRTITEVAAGGRRVRTFATGAIPLDLVAARGTLHVAQGDARDTQFRGPQPTAVAFVTQRNGVVSGTVGLPAGAGASLTDRRDAIAASAHAVWVIGSGGALVRIDPVSRRVARTLALDAVAVAADPGGAWVITRDGSLVHVAEQGNRIGVPIDLGGEATSLAVGDGAVWVVDPAQGLLERLDGAGGGSPEPIDVGAGAGPVAFAGGTVWVAQPGRQSVLRVDASERRVVGEVHLGGIPRDIAADGDGVWVSVTSPRATENACSPLEHAPGTAPDVVVALDLPLRTGGRSPTQAMVSAVRRELARRGFRAGAHAVGLLVCDDSTSQSGTFDPATCRANARTYAADTRVVAEIGPYNSPCAWQQLPVAAAAPRGPLAVVSPTTTDPLLGRPTRRKRAGAYVHVAAADDKQAQAAARFLRDRGHRRVFVLDDGSRYGLAVAAYFAHAAKLAGLQVAGRVSWGDARGTAELMRRVRRSRPDVVFTSGLLDNGAGAVVRALRHALPATMIAGSEGLLPVARLFDLAGRAASGVLITTGIQPAAGGAHPYTVFAARATAVTLAAVARSDGTRQSVARAIRADPRFDDRGNLRRGPVTILRADRPGGSRTNMSLAGGRVVAIVRP